MSDTDDKRISHEGESTTSQGKKQFIKEKIEPPRRKKKALLMAAILVVSAVIFGLLAAFTMVITRPWMEKLVGHESTEAAESVQIPQDESEEDTDGDQEDILISFDEDDLRETVESQMEAYLSTLDISELVGSYDCRNLIRDTEKLVEDGMVVISGSQDGMDVFQNEYTRSHQTFGVILAKTSGKVMILTESSIATKNDEIFVTFANRETVEAEVRGMDGNLGIAVIAVARDCLSEDCWKTLKSVDLGNSYRLKEGDTVIALGRPMGYTGSVNTGIVSYILKDQQGVDMNMQLLQTDMACSSDAAGILLNPEGKVLGWITQHYNNGSLSNLMAAISISDMKSYIEALSNGKAIASLGIQMQVVTPNLAEERELPQGIYVVSCRNEGPAYRAGLQNGDILVAIEDRPTLTEKELRRALSDMEPGTTVNLVVMRQGRDGYSQVIYPVELGTR